jgi:hypothetical protein
MGNLNLPVGPLRAPRRVRLGVRVGITEEKGMGKEGEEG